MSVILTVEDEFMVREYLGEILAETGHTIIAASNADEAISVLEARNDIRIIITDINMPGSMDGLKLAAAVRDKWPPIKIIIATGRGRPASHEMPSEALFVPKPYDQATVISAVARLT